MNKVWSHYGSNLVSIKCCYYCCDDDNDNVDNDDFYVGSSESNLKDSTISSLCRRLTQRT